MAYALASLEMDLLLEKPSLAIVLNTSSRCKTRDKGACPTKIRH